MRAPCNIVHVDLGKPLPSLAADPDAASFLVVFWWRDLPLGSYPLVAGELPLTASAIAEIAARVVAPVLGDRLLCRSIGALPDLNAILNLRLPLARLTPQTEAKPAQCSVSLIICTRNRPQALARCLKSLGAPRGVEEIIVVDNAPESDAVHRLVGQFPGVRYVPEPRAGLSIARNTGIAAARGEIIAFTDDDVAVDRDWPRDLVACFDDPLVMAATGLVLPAELKTEAQLVFERELRALSHGFRPVTYDARFFEKMKGRGAPVWHIGCGANMAFRRSAFELVGSFDERLGAGASGCSEDSEMWYRLLAAGYRCRYEPAAVVYHWHRRDWASLAQQVHQYMKGHVVALMVQYWRYGHRGNLRRAFLDIPAYYLSLLWQSCFRSIGARRRLLAAEITGWLAGLVSGIRLWSSLERSDCARTETKAARMPDAAGRRNLHTKAPLREFLRRNPFPHPLLDGFFYREKMRAINRVAVNKVASILEIGGGRSGLSALLYPGAAVVTLDRERAYGAADCNRQENVAFVCGHAASLPFADDQFDLVTMFDVIEHVAADRAALTEALRVLRPGGALLISAPNEHWRFPYYRLLRPVCPSETAIMAEWGHVRRCYRLRELEEMLGAPASAAASFISPLTVIAHDIAFSLLPPRLRRLLCGALLPVTLLGYAAHRVRGKGTETVALWRKR